MEKTLVFEASDKQTEALRYLKDKETNELLFGGGAGGGKSTLGCYWLIDSCLHYPDTRWLMGRAVLKSLKVSTVLTLFEMLNKWGFESGEDYEYHSMDGIIHFSTGSEIFMRNLYAFPNDPEFDELGSTEYTGAFIDEGSQVSDKAKNIVMSRIRYKLEENDLIPKLLIASNPAKNFLYHDFYKPWTEGKLPPHRKFVQALAGDNPFISPFYIENLKRLDKTSRERLLYGSFEYDDDPAKLMDYDKIADFFTMAPPNPMPDDRYLTADIARFGGDKTVIFQWRGFHVERIIVLEKQDVPTVAKRIDAVLSDNHIPRSNGAVDEDGVGGGVLDALNGCKGFINGSRPIETGQVKRYNYLNLRAQCYFMLAEKINNGELSCYPDIPVEYRSAISEDLEQVKQKNPDSDGKLQIIPKDMMKEKLGRSPDFGDAMMMRMLFCLAPKKRPPAIIGFNPAINERATNKQDAQVFEHLNR